MQFKDYYQILNVSRDASAQDIKRSFRQLAMQYHPDRNPENVREADEKFKEINEAYEILGDEQRRWQYNRLTSLRSAGMSFVIRGTGWWKPWGCGRRQGGQCHRQWRQDIE
jgi:DnaJ-class molecular chaperone